MSVVICCYTLQRWQQIVTACASVQSQSRRAHELILVVDHCPGLERRALRELSGVRVVASSGPPGLSAARNTGVATSTGEVVAFLDDDARAAPDWLEQLVAEYDDPDVIGVGGHVEPSWERARPRWFPTEYDWVVGCSYTGQPQAAGPVRNLLGANMSFRREALARAGGFRSDLGRVGARPSGCEETHLCITAAERWPGGTLRYQPSARVMHAVPPERGTWRYFRSRCFAEGRSKAVVTQLAGSRRGLATERQYVRVTLPRAAVRDAMALRLPALAASATGLAATAVGYLTGRLGPSRTGRPRRLILAERRDG